MVETEAPSCSGVAVKDLQFAYPGCAPSVDGFSLDLPRGSRCLLIGANGAGEFCDGRSIIGSIVGGGRRV